MKTIHSIPSSGSEDIKIRAEQIRLVYSNFIPALLGAVTAAIMLAVLQWSVIDKDIFKIWLMVFLLVFLVRGALMIRFNRLQPDDDTCVKWGRYFFYNSVVAGLLWAVGVIISFPENNIAYQLTLALIVIGLSAGATSTLAAVREILIVFIVPMMMTLIVLFVLDEHELTTTIAICVFIVLIFLLRGASMVYTGLRQNIHLRLQMSEREANLIHARESAQNANQAKSNFLAKMSHELRTPLHGVISYALMGEKRTQGGENEKLHKYFSRIDGSAQRLKLLLDDLLDLSKLESGNIELHFEKQKLLPVIESCIEEHRPSLDKKMIELNIDADNSLPEIEFDRVRIEQVIINLLSNAIKFAPESSVISVNVSLSSTDLNLSDVINVCVADQGDGVSIEDQGMIFENFYQAEDNPYKTQGTGLGLAISRELIQAHHGEIWYQAAEHGGSVFCLSLPVERQ